MNEEWQRLLRETGPLQGDAVVLEPLTEEHASRLVPVALDPELWRWSVTPMDTPADLAAYLETALRERAQGSAFPYVLVEQASGQLVGSSRYANMDASHRRLEIGWTWVGRRWQRTRVNTEAKYLLLRNAFERLQCVRVEFKADALNAQSRAALERIGAVAEGTLRRHMITASGRHRDSVYYSILDIEWPGVKQALEARLRG
jgi:RimJ/RimL family protein N-acetyltransferase